MQMKICAALLLLPCCTAFLPPSVRVGHEACSRVAGARRSSPRMVLEGLDGLQAALTPTNVVGFGSLGLFGLRMYTYFSAQSMIARLLSFFVKEGKTVELGYANGLRNIFYYDSVEQLIIPTGAPNQIDTIRDVIARLQAGSKSNYSVVALPEDFEELKLEDGSIDTIVSTYMLNKRKNPEKTFAKAMRLLKDGGKFVFVEPYRGEGAITSIRQSLGGIHKATGLYGDPALDIKGIVERWATAAEAEGLDCDVEVEEPGGVFALDPHLWGAIIKREIPVGDGEAPRRRKAVGKKPKGFASRKA